MNVNVIGVIQGRMGSSRLPGKLLAPLAGAPLLEVLVQRVTPAPVDEWWLATSTAPEDVVAAAWGEALGLRVHRGDPEDVLSRFIAIAENRRPAIVVRLTADDPFVDAGVVDALLREASALDPASAHLAEDRMTRTLPLGYCPEIVHTDAIFEAAGFNLPAHHRAHVTSWLWEAGRSIPFQAPSGWPSRPAWRWTVDSATDLEMAQRAFTVFGEDWATIDYPTMVRVLDDHPEITSYNSIVAQKATTEG